MNIRGNCKTIAQSPKPRKRERKAKARRIASFIGKKAIVQEKLRAMAYMDMAYMDMAYMDMAYMGK